MRAHLTFMLFGFLGSSCSESNSSKWVLDEPDLPAEPDIVDMMPDDCTVQASGARDIFIELRGERCRWSREELAAGVLIPYDVRVGSAGMIQSVSQDSGGCGRPDELGLIVFFEITADQVNRYCECDVGLCMRNDEVVPLVVGEYSGAIEWTGRNWTGPSDTNQPLGDAFEAGTATVTVSAQWFEPDGELGTSSSRMEIEIY